MNNEAQGKLSSRKFIATVMSLVLITGVSVASIWSTAIPSILPTFIGGIMGVLSLYMTGNVANKFVVGKQQVEVETTKVKEAAKKEAQLHGMDK